MTMTRLFILNLAMAIGWMFYHNNFSYIAATVGFGAGYGLLAVLCLASKNRYPIRLIHSVWLFFFFHYELVTSSLKVLWDIITPGQSNKPGFVSMPLTASTPLEIFFTANLISLTPGTLSIALSDDHKTLQIHAMFINDVDETIHSLKQFESVILRAFR